MGGETMYALSKGENTLDGTITCLRVIKKRSFLISYNHYYFKINGSGKELCYKARASHGLKIENGDKVILVINQKNKIISLDNFTLGKRNKNISLSVSTIALA